MDRCHNPSSASYKHYGALGVMVCKEWHTYANFEAWMLTQDHEGRELDKDILFQGNNLYSPETCRFVSPELNRLFTLRSALRGGLPLGVSKVSKGDRYRAQLNKAGQKIHLGTCDTAEEAHKLWQEAKAAQIEEVALLQDDEIMKSLLDRVAQLRVDLANGIQTTAL